MYIRYTCTLDIHVHYIHVHYIYMYIRYTCTLYIHVHYIYMYIIYTCTLDIHVHYIYMFIIYTCTLYTCTLYTCTLYIHVHIMYYIITSKCQVTAICTSSRSQQSGRRLLRECSSATHPPRHQCTRPLMTRPLDYPQAPPLPVTSVLEWDPLDCRSKHFLTDY